MMYQDAVKAAKRAAHIAHRTFHVVHVPEMRDYTVASAEDVVCGAFEPNEVLLTIEETACDSCKMEATTRARQHVRERRARSK